MALPIVAVGAAVAARLAAKKLAQAAVKKAAAKAVAKKAAAKKAADQTAKIASNSVKVKRKMHPNMRQSINAIEKTRVSITSSGALARGRAAALKSSLDREKASVAGYKPKIVKINSGR